VTRPVRLAVTLGDPRGIGPEIAAAALTSLPAGAEITLLGAREQIAAIPAAHRISTGSWKHAPGAPGARASEAGRVAGIAVERAAALALAG